MQRIVINNFGPISSAELDIKQFTVVIGEQASGKTYLSKLVYFFNKLPIKLLDFIYIVDKETISIDDLINYIRQEFFILFRSVYINRQNFTVQFTYETGSNIKVYFDEKNFINIEADFEILLKSIEEIVKLKKIDSNNGIKKAAKSFYELFFYIENEIDTYNQYKEVYIPAGRAFTNIFPKDIRLDIIRKLPDDYFYNFIRRIENIKDIFIDNGGAFESVLELNHNPLGNSLLRLISQVLKANYAITENGERLGFNTDKFVKIENASSGQQESLRVLQDLFILFVDKMSGFRVIEEPETHLFPTAQKKLIEFISIIGNVTDSSFFISTHSPYILSAFNNLLFAKGVEKEFGKLFEEKIGSEEKSNLPFKESWIDSDNFTAYSLKVGEDCRLIFDKKTGMIDENFLDDVSLEIADEFNIMFNIYKELTGNNNG